jgi:hypothetical protein
MYIPPFERVGSTSGKRFINIGLNGKVDNGIFTPGINRLLDTPVAPYGVGGLPARFGDALYQQHIIRRFFRRKGKSYFAWHDE